MGGGTSKSACKLPRPVTRENRTLPMSFALSKEHVQVMLDSLTSFRKEEKFCDLKIHIKDKVTNQPKTYFGHKCILAASSGRFREVIEGKSTSDIENVEEIIEIGADTSADTSAVDTSEVNVGFPMSSAIMDDLMRLFYTAAIDVKIDDIPELIEAAVRLRIPSLKKHCIWALHKGYKFEFFRPILQLTDEFDIPEVRDFVLRRTAQKFDDFTDNVAFLQLTEKEMQVLVENRRGCLSDGIVIPEVEMFNSILKWEKQDHKNREEHARHLLRQLHYHRIPKATLSGYVVTHDLVKGDNELMAAINEVLGADKKKVLRCLKLKMQTPKDDQNCAEELLCNGSGDGTTPVTQSSLLLCGGRLFDQMSAQVFQLDENQNSWHEITRMPTVLSYHGAVAVGNTLYVAGGEDTTISGSHSIANLWRYDPSPKNEWTNLPEMLHSRSYFFLGATNDSLYAFGGKSGKMVRNSVETYKFATGKWEFVHSLKTPRNAHAGCNHKNVFYINGGIVGKNSTNDMLKMEPTANRWTAMSPMRCARSKHSISPVRDRIYVIGGEDDSHGVAKPSTTAIECYTPEYDQWHTVAAKIPVQSDGEFGCAELDGRIYIVGGCKSQLVEHRWDVFSYEPEGNQWDVKMRLPKRLRGGVCVVLNTMI